MGTISTVGQSDNVSCGFYSGYVVSVVNQAGRYSPGLAMEKSDVEKNRRVFYGGRGTTLSELDAARYLNEGLGVVTGYSCHSPVMMSGVHGKVAKQLKQGKAMMWGDLTHWYALLAINSANIVTVYDPAAQKGSFITNVELAKVHYANFLVHPTW